MISFVSIDRLIRSLKGMHRELTLAQAFVLFYKQLFAERLDLVRRRLKDQAITASLGARFFAPTSVVPEGCGSGLTIFRDETNWNEAD
jgi:hypothetical protein